MKRVWKPLDVGGKRLYAVKLEHFNKETGQRAYGNLEPPLLVLADSPRGAAKLVHDIYNYPETPIRTECHGKAVKVFMPESWWNDGVPSEAENTLITELKEALEADSSDLWRVTNAIKKVVKSYSWITEGRGSYDYNDDDYRKETGNAFTEILNLINGIQPPAQKRFHSMMKKLDIPEIKHDDPYNIHKEIKQ